MLIRKIICA